MFFIKENVLLAFLEAAKNTFPDEFLGFLGGNSGTKTVEELVILPASFGKTFSSVQTHLIPIDNSIIGTCHSHPSGAAWPSNADKRTFSATGKIHLIAAFPFMLENVMAFDQAGKNIKVKII